MRTTRPISVAARVAPFNSFLAKLLVTWLQANQETNACLETLKHRRLSSLLETVIVSQLTRNLKNGFPTRMFCYFDFLRNMVSLTPREIWFVCCLISTNQRERTLTFNLSWKRYAELVTFGVVNTSERENTWRVLISSGKQIKKRKSHVRINVISYPSTLQFQQYEPFVFCYHVIDMQYKKTTDIQFLVW